MVITPNYALITGGSGGSGGSEGRVCLHSPRLLSRRENRPTSMLADADTSGQSPTDDFETI